MTDGLQIPFRARSGKVKAGMHKLPPCTLPEVSPSAIHAACVPPYATGEVHAIHPSIHLPQVFKGQAPSDLGSALRAMNGLATRLTFQIDSGTTNTGHTVHYIPLEFSVCRPHIRRLPVEDGIAL